MKNELMRGIVWTITDGIKDAGMTYGYAEDAKEAGKSELAALLIEDAKYRLGKVKEWYERAVSMHGQVDGVTEELIEVHKQAYRELFEKIMNFKM